MASEGKQYEITVAGRINDPAFQQARVLARFLATENSNVTTTAVAMVESDWEAYVAKKGRDLGGDAVKHRISPIVFANDSIYIGRTPELIAWMKGQFDVDGKTNNVLYTRMANKAYRAYIDGHKHTHCYFDIALGQSRPQRVVFELFTSLCPRTCENFRALCTGEKGSTESGLRLSYENTPFHRVVRGGWVQAGDINGGHGDGGESIYGPTFADETFDVKHDRPGILAMASNGSAHSNGSQFYVSLAPLPFLDGKRVAFGRVISGLRTIRAIERLPSQNQRPTTDVTIVACGVFTGAVYGKPPVFAAADESKSSSEERVRTALYARIFNSVDTDSTDSVSGPELADALLDVGGAVLRRFFVDGGIASLDAACRGASTLSFEAFCARAEEVYTAIHRGGVKFMVQNPFKQDARSSEEKAKYVDLRRPATKRQLLFAIFQEIDSSGDGKIDRAELLVALKNEDSLARRTFPKHATELCAWLEASQTDIKVSFNEFFAICSQALSLPGGR